MRITIRAAAVFAAALGASIVLAGCPLQPVYPPTITPIYAATSGNGLYVYNGTSWTNYPTTGGVTALTGVQVFGSGAGAAVLVSGTGGVAELSGSVWTLLNAGLGSTTVNRLSSSANVFASTSLGLSILDSGGSTWTNNSSVTPVNDAFSVGTFTLVAGGTGGTAGLYIYSGTALSGSAILPTTIASGSTKVTSVFVDVFGDLIAGTDAGFGIEGAAGWTRFPTASVNRVYADLAGNIYAATANGLYIVTTTATLILSGQNVHCVTVDEAGAIYAGTSAGLMVSRDGGSTWTTILAGVTVTAVATTAPLYSF